MSRRFDDKRRPVQPPPFISRFVYGIIALAVFGLLVVFWRWG
jgi:hypothetical protein